MDLTREHPFAQRLNTNHTSAMTKKDALAIVGSLGKTTKMPGYSWGITAKKCNVGSRLANVANSVCSGCYALRSYYRYPSVTKSHEKRLNLFNESLKKDNGESWIEAMAFLLKGEKYFRFMDSGDLQSLEMLDVFIRLCKRLPKCKFWLPTREYGIVNLWHTNNGAFPKNLRIRLSGLMVNGPAPEGIAKRLNVGTSQVSNQGNHTCHAIKNNNECGDCRKCWDGRVSNVIYKKH